MCIRHVSYASALRIQFQIEFLLFYYFIPWFQYRFCFFYLFTFRIRHDPLASLIEFSLEVEVRQPSLSP
jgi:hypothetical protein